MYEYVCNYAGTVPTMHAMARNIIHNSDVNSHSSNFIEMVPFDSLTKVLCATLDLLDKRM